MHDLVAVFDVGKTHTKLSLVDACTATLVSMAQCVNRPVRAQGMNQLDLAHTQAWLLATLAALPQKARITALVPVGHGAACVLVDARDQVLAAPDYEDRCFDETAAAYHLQRDAFAQTRSPRLPGGLNLGAQLFHLEMQRPQVFARATRILLLPQFWAWRLSGVAATEVSSLGVHSDLWQPERGEFSALARRRGWSQLFPPLRAAREVLGWLAPEIVTATGLPADCAVLCGVHDSNASWLSHRRQVQSGAALTVISSGTWTIAMHSQYAPERLREDRDMLANVDVFGAPVATARFMGGREYAAVAGADPATPTVPDLRRVLEVGAMALPSLAESGGPFQGRVGRMAGAQGLTPGERAALASLYVALVTDVMLELLGESDCIVIDGPLARNPLYPGLLGSLQPGATVSVSVQVLGVAAGALALALGDAMPPLAQPDQPTAPLQIDGLADYRRAWRTRCGID